MHVFSLYLFSLLVTVETVEPVMAVTGRTWITIKASEQKLRLVCRVFGSPTPIIEWRRENGSELTLENQTRVNLETLSFDSPPSSSSLMYTISNQRPTVCSIVSSLRLLISSEDDLGSYLCLARNTHGSSVATFTIRGKNRV